VGCPFLVGLRCNLVSKAKFVKSMNPKITIHFSKHEVAKSFAVLDGYDISEVALAPGRLGAPMHGRTHITVIRQKALRDPVPAMLTVSAKRCRTVDALLAQVSEDYVKGWTALMNSCSTSKTCDEDEVRKFLDDFRRSGQLPPDFEPSAATSFPTCGTSLMRARLEVLNHWMEQRGATHGYVEVRSKKPVHVDGTVGELRGDAYLCKSSPQGKQWVRLLVPHKLSIKGYILEAENLAVLPLTLADTMASNAVHMYVVFCVVLGACSVLPM